MYTLKDIVVDDMESVHLRQVLTIERNAQPMPWSRLSFEESLSNNYLCRVVCVKKTVTEEAAVVAFHIVSAIEDELHILNLAVAPALQGGGLGHVLMDDILAIARSRKLKKVFLEVRASNESAQSLYLKWQFEQIAIRKKYYRTKGVEREDALVMVRRE